jgi:hypothetical protein
MRRYEDVIGKTVPAACLQRVLWEHLSRLDFINVNKDWLHAVYLNDASDDSVASLGYHGEIYPSTLPNSRFQVDIVFDRDTLYLLFVSLPSFLRGLGNGKKLYAMVEELAVDLGLPRIVATPSGTTPRGESRWDYMLRLGYTPLNDHELEKVLSC